MSISPDKSLILNRIKLHYNLASNADLAKFMGVAPTTVSSWYTRNTFDFDLIFAKCVDLDANWLLTGEGFALKKTAIPPPVITPKTAPTLPKTAAIPPATATPALAPNQGIPLIPIEAMAGFGTGDGQILEFECERFMVPTFRGADYLIQVRGASMYPKYNSGDIVACKKLTLNDLFFQWNKVYVLDTEQGPIIKRVDIGKDDDYILIVSDNESYKPFQLHKSKINAIAIVMGVIRLE